MLRAKEALHKAGRIDKIGRGRISADNHAWLKSEYDKGERFSDWPKGEVQVTKTQDKETGAESTTVKVKRDPSQSTEKVVADLMPYLYPEDEFVAIETDRKTGKRVERSMRSACNNCRVSLVVCVCGQPRIVARDGGSSVRVDIERR